MNSYEWCSKMLGLMDPDTPLPPISPASKINSTSLESVTHARKFKEIFFRLRMIEKQLNLNYRINEGYISQDK